MPPRQQKKVPRKLKTHRSKLRDSQGRGHQRDTHPNHERRFRCLTRWLLLPLLLGFELFQSRQARSPDRSLQLQSFVVAMHVTPSEGSQLLLHQALANIAQ
jgi:hypothetical protein